MNKAESNMIAAKEMSAEMRDTEESTMSVEGYEEMEERRLRV